MPKKPWWCREPVDPESLKPDVPKEMAAPPCSDGDIMVCLQTLRRAGIHVSAIADTCGVDKTDLRKVLRLKKAISVKMAYRLSWLVRGLNSKEIKFIRHRRGHWVLVRGDVDDQSLNTKAVGICACGRYQSCPCGLAEHPDVPNNHRKLRRKRFKDDAYTELEVQQLKLPPRV